MGAPESLFSFPNWSGQSCSCRKWTGAPGSPCTSAAASALPHRGDPPPLLTCFGNIAEIRYVLNCPLFPLHCSDKGYGTWSVLCSKEGDCPTGDKSSLVSGARRLQDQKRCSSENPVGLQAFDPHPRGGGWPGPRRDDHMLTQGCQDEGPLPPRSWAPPCPSTFFFNPHLKRQPFAGH